MIEDSFEVSSGETLNISESSSHDSSVDQVSETENLVSPMVVETESTEGRRVTTVHVDGNRVGHLSVPIDNFTQKPTQE